MRETSYTRSVIISIGMIAASLLGVLAMANAFMATEVSFLLMFVFSTTIVTSTAYIIKAGLHADEYDSYMRVMNIINGGKKQADINEYVGLKMEFEKVFKI